MTTVFGFPTHKYKAKHDLNVLNKRQPLDQHVQEQPTDFLRKLFFREKPPFRHSASGDRGHRDRARRSGGGPVPRRSSTLPTTSPTESAFHSTPALPSPMHTRESTADSQTDATSVASSRRVPLSPASTLRMRPHAPRMQTEPTAVRRLPDVQAVPIPIADSHRSASHASVPSLPKALVMSGLENVQIPAQRLLLRVLQDRRVIIDGEHPHGTQPHDFGTVAAEATWDLPEDFFMIYVCPLDPHERPPILETLVSRCIGKLSLS